MTFKNKIISKKTVNFFQDETLYKLLTNQQINNKKKFFRSFLAITSIPKNAAVLCTTSIYPRPFCRLIDFPH